MRWRIIFSSASLDSGEHRLPACRFSATCRKVCVPIQSSLRENVVGKLPTTAGWQPALPRISMAKRLREHEIRVDLFGHLRFISRLQSQQCSKGNHGRVVGTQRRLGVFEFKSVAIACLVQLPSQFLVSTHAAANGHEIDVVFLRCCNRLCHQHVDNCLLERRAEIRQDVIPSFARNDIDFRQQISHRGF